MKLDQIHNYWKNPTENNLPERYINPKRGDTRTRMLYDLVTNHTEIDLTSSILELGCNVGRNLNFFFERGYDRLGGIEINEDAIRQMKDTYPNLHKIANVTISSLEMALPMQPKSDLVFTMAMLEHIHTDSEWIFRKGSVK